MGGNVKHYLTSLEWLRRVLPIELFDRQRRPVCKCRGAVYGFARPRRDFIMSFARWLIMNKWRTVPETPALHVLWHDGDDADALRRAMKAKEYVDAGERAGRNVRVRAAENFRAEPWRSDAWRTTETVTEALAYAKTVSIRSSQRAMALRTLVWNVVRTQFNAKEPVHTQEFLRGMGRDLAVSGIPSRSMRVCGENREKQSDPQF